MNALYKRLACLCLYLFIFTSVNASTLVNFQELDFSQIRNQGKKILVSFSADWCLPCQVMNENIFSDEEIASLINENFIAIKADIDSEKGKKWNETYNVNFLPTTLFAHENGNEIERLKGMQSKEDFLNFLKRIIATETINPKASFVSNLESKPVVTKTITPDPVVKKPIATSTILTTSHYSIQVGAFGTVENALKMLDKLNQKGIYNTSLLEENTNGKLYQKVIVGSFISVTDAQNQLKFLEQKGLKGFLKKT